MMRADAGNADRRSEGFPDQRLTLLPRETVERAARHPATGALYPTRVGFFPRAEGHWVERRTPLDEHLLILCAEGAGTGAVGGTAFTLRPGRVAWFPAGRPHWYAADGTLPWSIAWAHFRGTAADAYLAAAGFSEGTRVLAARDAATLRERFEALHALAQGPPTDAALLGMHARLADFFAELALARLAPDAARHRQTERLETVIRYLRENVDRRVSVPEMAARAHWTPNHFARIFRDYVNQSPASFFRHLKLARACELLRQTDWTVARIAAEVGYDDPFYFSRTFRDAYRLTPTAYRSIDG